MVMLDNDFEVGSHILFYWTPKRKSEANISSAGFFFLCWSYILLMDYISGKKGGFKISSAFFQIEKYEMW